MPKTVAIPNRISSSGKIAAEVITPVGLSEAELLTIRIANVVDTPTSISGVVTGSVSKTGNTTSVSGTLDASDPDPGDSDFIVIDKQVGSYGEFSIDVAGNWHYDTLATVAMNALKPRDVVTEVVTVETASGSSSDITLLIFGGKSIPTKGSIKIVAGPGNNWIETGDISIRVTCGNGIDTIYSGRGRDVIDVGEGGNFVDAGGGRNSILCGAGDNTINTGYGGGSVDAGDGLNTIYAAGGSNKITLGDGNNIMIVGTGRDTITAGNGQNTLSDEGGSNTYHFGNGNNFITLSDGRATVTAGGGNNEISFTGKGSNKILLGGGNNMVATTEGRDTIVVGNGINIIDAGHGHNTILTGHGANTIYSGAGNDRITVGNGGNTINSGAGNDKIICGRRDDTINAGAGADTISSGGGSDRIIFDNLATKAVDKISDFTHGSDLLVLDGNIFSALVGGITSENVRVGSKVKAQDDNDFLLFDSGKSQLFYDADANGSQAALLLVTLTGVSSLLETDFLLL